MAATGFLFGDSFDGYPTADITQKWTSFVDGGSSTASSFFSISALALRNGSSGLRYDRPNGDADDIIGLRKTLNPGLATTCVARFAFRYVDASQPSYTIGLFGIYDNADQQISIGLRTDGKLIVYRGSDCVTGLLGTSTAPLLEDTWYSIKLATLIDPAVGTVQLWINDVSQFSVTGANTRANSNSQWTNVIVGQVPASGQGGAGGLDPFEFNYDDLDIRDDNDGRGDLIAICLRAQSGNGANTGYTPSTGIDHGAMVDETDQDGDTTYNEGSSVGQQDTYTLENLPAAATVAFVQTTEVARKTDAGSRTVSNVIRISGVDYTSAVVHAPSQSYSHLLTQYDESPATSTTWTDSEVNAMESGQEIIT
jgi:hypothetical protein